MNYDVDFGGDTDVIDLPLRPPAAVIHDRPQADAIPAHIRSERTKPYRFPTTVRVAVRVA